MDAVEKWWRTEGQHRYRNAGHLTILADGGGSNSSSSRVWKYGLQTRVCDRHGLNVTVAHYPSGASKWNPIEHRLFSEISKNWAARPLDSYETILKYLRTTTTTTGLRVRAHLVRKAYKKGVKITREQMDELDLTNTQLPSGESWTHEGVLPDAPLGQVRVLYRFQPFLPDEDALEIARLDILP